MGRVTRINVIHVTIQHQRRPIAALNTADEVSGLIYPHLIVAESLHLGPYQVRNACLIPGGARHLNQPLSKLK